MEIAPENIDMKLDEVLRRLNHVESLIVMGEAFPDDDELKAKGIILQERSKGKRISFHFRKSIMSYDVLIDKRLTSRLLTGSRWIMP